MTKKFTESNARKGKGNADIVERLVSMQYSKFFKTFFYSHLGFCQRFLFRQVFKYVMFPPV